MAQANTDTMRPDLFALAAVAATLHAPATTLADPPTARAAAVCADYPNQAAAQRAADTRDSDGDGIYCEALPCPCAGPGQASPAPKPVRQPATFQGRCGLGRLPDHGCTPGVTATANVDRVCTPGYTGRGNVSVSPKNRVYAEYGIRHHSRGQYEIDHLIPLELGGSNSIRNLFAEAAEPKPA
jgi:hypothetical protein